MLPIDDDGVEEEENGWCFGVDDDGCGGAGGWVDGWVMFHFFIFVIYFIPPRVLRRSPRTTVKSTNQLQHSYSINSIHSSLKRPRHFCLAIRSSIYNEITSQ